jgi:PiT family inorganic phosphate transporter
MQWFSAGFLALSHGLNDAQKTMGIITLALVLFGFLPAIEVPLWVKLLCALAMCLGTAIGGWRIVKTMGSRIFKLEPYHGFAAESVTGVVIAGASFFGAPVSTTHTVSSAIFGVGSVKRINAVHWTMARQFIVAWTLTLPAAGLVGAGSYCILRFIWP